MIMHPIEALADAGVTDIVLAVNYRPEVMEARLAKVRFICRYVTYISRRKNMHWE